MIHQAVVAVALLYPFVIYFGLPHISPGTLAGILASVVLIRVLLGGLEPRWKLTIVLLAVIGFSLHWWMHDDEMTLRFYPALINLAMFVVFAVSLFQRQPLIEKIARQRGMAVGAHNLGYLRGLTIVWALFFGVNLLVSTWTALYTQLNVWLLYNGFISYVLIGTLIAGELVFRRFYRQRLIAASE